jgi:hypothetical protein
MTDIRRVAYVIVTSAPPVLNLDEFLLLLDGRGLGQLRDPQPDRGNLSRCRTAD